LFNRNEVEGCGPADRQHSVCTDALTELDASVQVQQAIGQLETIRGR
jgi:hypothetical protein